MEYEKFIVSLYQDGEKVQSGIFLYIEKQSNKSIVSIKNVIVDKGFLFIYFNNKCIIASVNKKLSFVFNEEFFINYDYLFCLYCDGKKFIGRKGNIKNEKEILSAIEKKYISVKNVTVVDFEADKNNVTDHLIFKMFNKESDLYFKLVKSQLSALFASFGRCRELEEVFKNSKFIKSGNEFDESYAGIIYKNNKPFAIAVGFEGLWTENYNDNRFKFYPIKNLNNGKGAHLSIRRVSDGDLV